MENEERFLEKWGRQRSKRIAWILSVEGNSSAGIREKIRLQANEGHKVWVFHTVDMTTAIPRHLQVVPVPLPQFLFFWWVFWRASVKKKKFEAVTTISKQRLGQWIGRLHGARVVHES